MPAGRVLECWRYPVKSMAGERLDGLMLDETGATGDRRYALSHGGKKLTALTAPKLLAWQATGEDPVMVRAPRGRFLPIDDPFIVPALSQDLGKDVVVEAHPEGRQDIPGTLLVVNEGSRRALSQELGADVDHRRFRGNLVVDLDSPPFEEAGWIGSRLAFTGGVVLRVLEACDRCLIPTRDPDTREAWPGLLTHINEAHGTFFGVRATVEVPGRVATGEKLELQG